MQLSWDRLGISSLPLQVKSLQGLSKFPVLGSLKLSCNELEWAELPRLCHMTLLSLTLSGNPQLDSDPNCELQILSLSVPLCRALSLYLTYTLSLFLSPSLSLSHTPSHTHTLSTLHTHTLSLSFFLSPSLSLTHTLTRTLSLSLPLSLMHTCRSRACCGYSSKPLVT